MVFVFILRYLVLAAASAVLIAGPVWADDHSSVTVATRSFQPEQDLAAIRPEPRAPWAVPHLAWDGVEGAEAWTAATMAALRGPGAPLLQVMPADIHAWCPAYPGAGPEQRAAFWAGLVSTLAYYESTHDPEARGYGGPWYGLLQIVPATARAYSCEVGTRDALFDGPANLRCGLRIMAVTVPRDGVISQGMQGVAADWGPFHSRRKREGMRDFVLNQSYCIPQSRPELRPAELRIGAPGIWPMPRPEQAQSWDLRL